jgi:hypothetical protein
MDTPEQAAEPVASNGVIALSGRKFLLGCALAAVGIGVLGRFVDLPAWPIAVEVMATILALFLLGSFKYQLHKNALTYGAAMVIVATFLGAWWTQTGQRGAFSAEEVSGWWPVLGRSLLTFRGLDELVHADTMLFILGLTLFVSVIAQTRVLEDITFLLLRRCRGFVLPTVVSLLAVVSFASGILDGVSMIGLTIRTIVIILFLARVPIPSVRYAIMVCTIVTTVCGMWLAYGEPPNLIMKANLLAPGGASYLTDAFFLRYCLPAAVVSFLCVAWSLRKRLRRTRVDLAGLDVLDAHSATVRFLQASRHGEVLIAVEFVEDHRSELGRDFDEVLRLVRDGEPLGAALVHSHVAQPLRLRLLGHYVDEEIAADLDRHYMNHVDRPACEGAGQDAAIREVMARLQKRRQWARLMGIIALAPFVGGLVWHALNHTVPLFVAPFAGLAVAIVGIVALPRVRRLAMKEARHEYAEYYFLFPLFLSITLLTRIGFFNELQAALQHGIREAGVLAMALAQFAGATALSAILDNNVVADFASRALRDLPVALLQLFAMAQIAGYAAGGCWTHIGSAQSVVAFAFIRRNCDETYTPLQWIREITGVLVTVVVALMALIAVESLIFE